MAVTIEWMEYPVSLGSEAEEMTITWNDGSTCVVPAHDGDGETIIQLSRLMEEIFRVEYVNCFENQLGRSIDQFPVLFRSPSGVLVLRVMAEDSFLNAFVCKSKDAGECLLSWINGDVAHFAKDIAHPPEGSSDLHWFRVKEVLAMIGAGLLDDIPPIVFDLDEAMDVPYYIHKLNSFLPKDIAVLNIHLVHEDAHARFDATKRTYQYHIHTTKDAFESDDSWYYLNSLNIDLMNEACKILFNHIDFECFSKVHTDVNTFNCKIYEAHWQQIENRLVFKISADRFLRNMVRAIVGTMVNIGLEKVSLQDFSTIIEGKDRNKAGFSVPAHGLYLTKVEYSFLEKIIKI